MPFRIGHEPSRDRRRVGLLEAGEWLVAVSAEPAVGPVLGASEVSPRLPAREREHRLPYIGATVVHSRWHLGPPEQNRFPVCGKTAKEPATKPSKYAAGMRLLGITYGIVCSKSI